MSQLDKVKGILITSAYDVDFHFVPSMYMSTVGGI